MSWGTLMFITTETPIKPEFSPPLDTRLDARKEAARLIKGVAARWNQPKLSLLADDMRMGRAKDDTVYAGGLVVAVIDYEDNPQAAATAWLEDFARRAAQGSSDDSE